MKKLYIFSEDKKNVTEGQNQEKLSNSKWLQSSWDCRSRKVGIFCGLLRGEDLCPISDFNWDVWDLPLDLQAQQAHWKR